MSLNDTWNDTELLLYGHELDPLETRITEEQDPTFIVDHDQSTININLTDNEEESSRDLNSRNVITSSLSIDRSFEAGTNEQETALKSKFSKISLISDHINHRSRSEREGIERVNFFSSIYICHFEDEFKPIEKFSDGMIIQYSSSTVISFY
jgi:hypothetical protein